MELKKIVILYLSLISTFSWASEDEFPLAASSSSISRSQEILPIENRDVLVTDHSDMSIIINMKDLDEKNREILMRTLMRLNIPLEIPASLSPLHSEIQFIHQQSQCKNRVLCLDGGGTRGIIEAIILKYIEETTGKRIHELFDVVVCTSTGTLIGAAVCYDRPVKEGTDQTPTGPYTAQEIIDFYRTKSPEIFSKYNYTSVYGLRGTQYKDGPALEAYAEYFGETRLSDAKTSFIATSQNLSLAQPHIFSSQLAKQNIGNETIDPPLAKVVRASTAAPTYFDPIVIGTTTHSDGGVTNNNPAEIAILKASQQLGISPHELLVFSLGAGFTDPDPAKSYTNLGGIEWLEVISLNIFNGKNQDFTVSQWLELCRRHDVFDRGSEKNYLRMQPNLPPDLYKLAEYSSQFFDALTKIAEAQITEHKEELDTLINRLVQGCS